MKLERGTGAVKNKGPSLLLFCFPDTMQQKETQSWIHLPVEGFAMRPLYRIEEHRHGVTHQVFTYEDPRTAGYKGHDLEEGVTLDYDREAVHGWADGERRPEACLGRAVANSKHYKVFKYSSDLESAGYQPLPGTTIVFGSWKDYAGLLLPPDPEQTADEDWYSYLDKMDEVSRLRRQRAESPAPPSGGNRDEVAAWVAKTHLITDDAVREVWYLPQGAPPGEIRLLELNDRLAGDESKAEAIDFGLDVEGAKFRLFVADITSEQLERIKQDPTRLPAGWSLDETRVWRRGA